MGEFYSLNEEELFERLNSSKNGLTSYEAKERQKTFGLNEISEKDKRNLFTIFLSQFNSPLILILIFASILAGFLGEIIDAVIILAIVIMNAILGFYQEYKSDRTLKDLKKYISFSAKVLRNNEKTELNIKELVPGDIVFLNIGDIVPADLRILESQELSVNESAITGESLPVKKISSVIKQKNIPLSKQENIVFMGSVITSGLAKGIVVLTGKNTEFGKTANILSSKEPPSDFQKGIKKFGNFLIKLIFSLTIFVFLVNALLGKGFFDSFLFAIALAVGITPELLPIIITIALSNGAMHMAKKKVVVKKLASIEDLGNIDTLCIDKTGTLTENKITLEEYWDIDENENKEIIESSLICNSAIVEEGLIKGNIIDVSIWEYAKKQNIAPVPYKKIEDIEFDYTRRRISSIIERNNKRFLISKGEPISILDVCNKIKRKGKISPILNYREKIIKEFESHSKKGYRIIAVSYKEIENKKDYNSDDEKRMVFLGFISFLDPPKESAKESLRLIKELGIELKILTGDNELITNEICKKVGLKIKNRIILGNELLNLKEDIFSKIVDENNVFARITPEQKYKIVEILSKKDHIVGFLGDGVNDAPALKVADVGITVDTAVDVAKDSADVILLLKDLEVLADGITEGRKTFGNTIKYILNTISANFGNMFSLAATSLYFNFIPLLPTQILLNNFISDVPLGTVSTDNVDEGYVHKPKRWNIKMISKFMVFFGLISSIFDIMTMLVIWFFLAPNNPKMFRTVWFTESVLSEILITFVIRTKKPFWKSKPSNLLIISSLIGILLVFFVLFYSPLAKLLSFEKMSLLILGSIILILSMYILLTEFGKRIFYKFIQKEPE